MSRFYADIKGTRGPATRMGSKRIRGHIRGWDVGVIVFGYINKDGEDEFQVTLTSGSNGRKLGRSLGKFTARDLGDK